MAAGRICTRIVATAAPTETVRVAAQRMAEHDVGTLVVVGPLGHEVLGLVTDRDLTVRCTAAGRDPEITRLSDVMTTSVQTIDEHTPVEEAVARMGAAGIRRLVVTGAEGALLGLLSVDDVLELLVEEVAAVGRLLEKQAPRIAA